MGTSEDWLRQWVQGNSDELSANRRHLHAHPELGFGETQTTAFLVAKLRAAGLDPQVFDSGTGLHVDVGQGDRVVGYRADIDALPLRDVKTVAYRSSVEGVCHACGHDAHATIALGLAQALAACPTPLPGRVRFVFQPAEEAIPGGAGMVVASGVLHGLQRVLALHCDPRLEVGKVGLLVGPITAAADSLEVEFHGPGGHTARPHLTVDLVDAMARVVVGVPGLLSRQVDARAGMSLVFAAIGAGIAHNTIPDTGHLRGTVRTLQREAWDDAGKTITQLIEQVAASTGAEVIVRYQRGVPPVVNDADCIALIEQGVRATIGEAGVSTTTQSMGAEDFGWYADAAPIGMVRLGTHGAGPMLDLHQGSFDIDEDALGIGVQVMGSALLTSLAHDG